MASLAAGVTGGEQFDGGATSELDVLGFVDGAAGAFADGLEEAVRRAGKELRDRLRSA